MEIEVQGNAERLSKFMAQLKANKPQAAVVTTEEVLRITPTRSAGLEILMGQRKPPAAVFDRGEQNDTDSN
jgi:hypothetical protein